ncbi:MAG: hypothetical protein ACRD0K_15020 [Egibacteraceae bacterium]
MGRLGWPPRLVGLRRRYKIGNADDSRRGCGGCCEARCAAKRRNRAQTPGEATLAISRKRRLGTAAVDLAKQPPDLELECFNLIGRQIAGTGPATRHRAKLQRRGRKTSKTGLAERGEKGLRVCAGGSGQLTCGRAGQRQQPQLLEPGKFIGQR